MLGILFFLFMFIWSVGGGVAAIVLYDTEVLPVKNPCKQKVSTIVCGPATWIGIALWKVFVMFRDWLKEEEDTV